jgi:prophage regulatory protein
VTYTMCGMKPEVVAAAEIAELLGLSRQRVTQLTAKPDFPLPLSVLTVGKIWLRQDIEDYARRTGRTVRSAELS